MTLSTAKMQTEGCGAAEGQEPSAGGHSELVSAMELSERAAELEVRLDVAESERRHARQVLEALPQAVIVVDPFEDVVLVSQAAARLFGVPQGTSPSGPVIQLIGDAALAALVAQTCKLHMRGASRRTRRTVVTATGARTFDITLLCVCDQDDGRPSPWGAVVIMEETEAIALQHAAELTAAVAHELRTPLSSVRAYTEMLLDGEAGDEKTRREFLQIISLETERLTRLVENMQLLARIEAGQAVAPSKQVDVCAVLRRTADIIAPHIADKRLTLKLEVLDARVETMVRGDEDLLVQALLNVMDNAVKYTPAGGSVSAEVNCTDRGVVVVVRDAGVGIPADELPLVFDKFFRSRTGRGVAQGSGLGLALVRQIVEGVHGGQVEIESECGTGTTVRMSLERGEADAVARARIAVELAECNGEQTEGGPHVG